MPRSSRPRCRKGSDLLVGMIYYFCVAGTDGTRTTPGLSSKIRIDPAAASVFPSAQLSEACGIITIDGLGVLGGDYTLLDPRDKYTRPAWIGTSTNTHSLTLSYLQNVGVWAIGANGLFNAFVAVDSVMPPARSRMWQIFNQESSAFEGSGNNVVAVSCPGRSLCSSICSAKRSRCTGSSK